MAAFTNGTRCGINAVRKGQLFMSGVRIASMGLLACGLALHTYTAVALASSFHPGFWLWSVSPYLIAALMLWRWRRPFAVLGATTLPLLADLAMHIAVFKAPQGSTSALGLMAMPLWNLVLMIPFGSAVGWLIDRRNIRTNFEQSKP